MITAACIAGEKGERIDGAFTLTGVTPSLISGVRMVGSVIDPFPLNEHPVQLVAQYGTGRSVFIPCTQFAASFATMFYCLVELQAGSGIHFHTTPIVQRKGPRRTEFPRSVEQDPIPVSEENFRNIIREQVTYGQWQPIMP